MALSNSEPFALAAEASDEPFKMDEDSFRAFYGRTSRPLWHYLARVSGSRVLADDLLQEAYYRFLRADLKDTSELYLKNYLFRTATNLLRDHWRRGYRASSVSLDLPAVEALPDRDRTADDVQRRSDLARLFERLKPRERELLWQAYAEGASHKEIAERLGLRPGSIRLMLFRARHKAARLLRGRKV